MKRTAVAVVAILLLIYGVLVIAGVKLPTAINMDLNSIGRQGVSMLAGVAALLLFLIRREMT